MANRSKKIACSYRFEKSVADMIKTISVEENRSEVNVIETIVKEYYKKTRRIDGEMENLSNEQLIEIATNEYNKMAKDLGYEKMSKNDFKVIKEELNVEFENRAYHIDSGQYVLKSGIESKHWIKCNKDKFHYLVENINFYHPTKKFENKVTIDYLY
jgi:hypothetical protein